ncbi:MULTISPECIES: nucleoside diphosphate kinase regulator [unclassified Mesorhizobium]|uniref:nucleoside diphosphate kinase regulator n=1 Tax=unclassified Mesorhizobium TaxID=325217 RepID=UPI001129FA1A|nr:nucleoside diphosphate kinase regulator [Mesorhizobium sp. B2-4-16]TPL65021.1 nucleoside diphosphate kinase regulator [Mesorhizobium sp. B2-4-3]
MASDTKKLRKPTITMTRTDHERLLRLADTHATRNPAAADELLAELDRARVVADGRIAVDVVRMGSTVRFVSDLGEDRRVTLVFPGEADIAEGKVSILTPIGAALIGLSAGQSINWTARDGRVHRLTAESVEAPMPASTPSTACRVAGRVMTEVRPPCRLSLFGGCLLAGS